jgi:hypothetical protein
MRECGNKTPVIILTVEDRAKTALSAIKLQAFEQALCTSRTSSREVRR